MFVIPQTYWTIKKTPGRGRGVFTKKEIAGGTVIGDYLGIMTRPKDVTESPIHFFAMGAGQLSILPNSKKPGIHLINHSCGPNCAIHLYQGHTLYVAVRRIFFGEELTVNYMCRASGCDSTCEQDICRCGSPVCRGTIHTPERLYKAWALIEHDSDAYYKKYLPQKPGVALEALKKYPLMIPDSSAYEIYGAWHKPTLLRPESTLPPLNEIRQHIRISGRRLYFKKINLVIDGISDNQIIGHYT